MSNPISPRQDECSTSCVSSLWVQHQFASLQTREGWKLCKINLQNEYVWATKLFSSLRNRSQTGFKDICCCQEKEFDHKLFNFVTLEACPVLLIFILFSLLRISFFQLFRFKVPSQIANFALSGQLGIKFHSLDWKNVANYCLF